MKWQDVKIGENYLILEINKTKLYSNLTNAVKWLNCIDLIGKEFEFFVSKGFIVLDIIKYKIEISNIEYYVKILLQDKIYFTPIYYGERDLTEEFGWITIFDAW